MKPFTLAAVLAVFCFTTLQAQELPEFPKPQKEHELLKQFVGEWETYAESAGAPGQPAMKCSGKIESKMLGGFWVVSKIEADMAGTKFKGLQTVGYDPESKKYVGTWVDTMMNHMWKYEGSYDEAFKTLTLESEGPNFIKGEGLGKYRDVFQFKSKDEIITTSLMQSDDGKWVTFMTGTAKRKK